jgi:formylglycine-generating enzyme required for sulfatase activity
VQTRRLEFEFEGFAQMLAGLAWNPDNGTPFTVVVKGGWGRGKTTLLRRAQWMLEHPEEVDPGVPAGVREVRTLWFNAWKYPDDDTVLAGLLGAAIDRLRKGGMLEQLRLLVDSYESGTLRALFALAAPAPLRDLIAGGVEDRFRPVHEKRAFHDTFRDLFNQVSRLLFETAPAFRDTGGLSEGQLWSEDIQRRQVLAVFLDDLDRCRRERVVEVLEAINLFLDLPGVCFFLGLDWDRLVDALPETVRDAQGRGDEFLEKVVQVAFDLPEVSPADAEAYVAGLLAGTDLEAVLVGDGAGDGEGRSEDVRVLAKALETRHPRHVKRFLNDLSITLAALEGTGKLGDGEDQLPESAVVSWHLLSEILPVERWREVRALPANLMTFLRKTERLERAEAEEAAAQERETPAEWEKIRASGLPDQHLKILRQLSDRQRHLLVYFATPPKTETAKGRRTAATLDLFDPESGAWVEIPGGTFWMGAQRDDPDAQGYDPEAREDESPVHRVTVSPFRIARYPVTNAEYAVFVQEAGWDPPAHWEDRQIPEGKEQHPVARVSWEDALAFCNWFSQRVIEAGERLRVGLPTEAEWELAARGEQGRRYPWGNGKPNEQLANFGLNVGDTTPVGSYPEGSTPEGVKDLAGNVFEWCADMYRKYPDENEVDPVGPASGKKGVLRGGAFGHGPDRLRAAYRHECSLKLHDPLVGFRLLCRPSGDGRWT